MQKYKLAAPVLCAGALFFEGVILILNDDKVSIIVPVYNVEKYLARCIDSIIFQTYSNLEIILINDGSTDNCGKICNDYAIQDTRIKVIHQENQGLAETRNVGLRAVSGKYILFVDSDDWIELDTVSQCLNYLHEYNADVVCFRAVREYANSLRGGGAKNKLIIMNGNDALSAVHLPKYISVSSCNKLYKADLFKGIEYPRGKISEDVYTTYKIIANADKVICIDKVFYHYFVREDSISHRTFSPQTYNVAEGAQNCFDFAMSKNISWNKDQMSNLLCGLWRCKITVVNYMLEADKIDKAYIKQLQHEIKLRVVFRCRLLEFKRKVQFLLFKCNINIYKLAYIVFKPK